MKHSREYTKENIDFLRKHAQTRHITNKMLTDMYNERFETKRTPNSIAYIRSKHGIILNNTTAKSAQGKNNRGSRPIGDERIRKGYVEIKVKQPNVWDKKHRYLWEQYHGRTLKRNEVIIFIDQDNRNFDIDNLMMITRAEMGEMNRHQMLTQDEDINKASIAWVKLLQRTREIEKE